MLTIIQYYFVIGEYFKTIPYYLYSCIIYTHCDDKILDSSFWDVNVFYTVLSPITNEACMIIMKVLSVGNVLYREWFPVSMVCEREFKCFVMK